MGSDVDIIVAKRKQKRMVLLLSAVTLLLLTGVLVLVFYPQQEAVPLPEITPPPDNVKSVLTVDRVNLSAVAIMPQDGDSYTIRLDREFQMYLLEAADRIFHGDQTELDTVVFAAVMLENLTLVTDNADDAQLAAFGFNNPRLTWQLQYFDGAVQELQLGAQIPAGEGSYIRSADSREIFIIGQVQTSFLLKSLYDVYDITFLPIMPSTEENPTWENIASVKLEKPDGEIIEAHKRSSEDLAGAPIGTTIYQLMQPFEADCNEFMIQTIFMEAATRIQPESVVETRSRDLSVYGLDDPAILTVVLPTAEDDYVIRTLLIGRYDETLVGRFVMIEGHDAVLLDPSGDYSFLDVDPHQLLLKLIWLHRIDDVSSVDFYLDGVLRVLRLEHDGDAVAGFLDDVQLSVDNTRRLYSSALSIIASGGSDAPIPETAPQYSITIHFQGGGSETVELYELSDLQFLIVHEGVSTGSYITRLVLYQNLLYRFEILDAGGDLTR